MINADIVTVDGVKYIKVWFRYNPDAVNKMKLVEGARFNPKTKLWSIPYDKKEDFEKFLSGSLIIWHSPSEIKGGGISEEYLHKTPMGLALMHYDVKYDEEGRIKETEGWKVPPLADYQVEGFNELVRANFLILADSMGLGKTWQMATALECKYKLGQLKRGVILCKASLLYNWKEEVEKFTDLKAVIYEGNSSKRIKLYCNLTEDTDWNALVVSYETFRNDINRFQDIDSRVGLDFMVADEAQKIANPTTKIGTVIHYIPFKYKYLLTGSPLPNSPLQAYNYFKLGGAVKTNWWAFQKRYAIFGGFNNKEVIGYKNMKELKVLFELHMLRRLKHDKLKSLPPALFRDIRVDMTTKQAKAYKAVKESIMEDLKESSIESLPNALSKLMRLQQVTDSPALLDIEADSAKLSALDDLTEDIIDTDDNKVIIFTKFKTMVDLLLKKYERYNPAYIHGGVTAENRHKMVKAFQNDKEVKMFIGCAPACREGLTLTASADVIFIDMEWNWANYEQAYSRAHRIGQHKHVMVHNIICRSSIDEHVYNIIKSKKNMSETLLDVKVTPENKSSIKKLVESMIGG